MELCKKNVKNVNVFYSGHALSFEIASLGMSLKHRKQITLNEHNMVKNPNWLEADQLAIYKADRGFELGTTVKQIQLVAGWRA